MSASGAPRAIDQADGLRRLLAQRRMRVLAVTAGCRGAGKATAVIGLAAAASVAGLRVFVIDTSAGEIPAALSLTWRADLLHLLRGERGIHDVLLAGPGFSVLPAAKGVAALVESGREAQPLLEGFARLAPRPDLVLVNLGAEDAAAARLFSAKGELLLVARAGSQGMRAAYSRMKALAFQGRRRFRILLTHCDADEARAVHSQMAEVARRFLTVELALAGAIPPDCALRTGGAALAATCSGHFLPFIQALGEWGLSEYGT